MSKISVAKGLVELKTLDARIQRAIQDGHFIGVTVGGKPVTEFPLTPAELVEKAPAALQSATDLIKRRDAIKSAIVVSNATTMVKVAGVEMTVAAAIEKKASIVYLELLRDRLRQQLGMAATGVERINQAVQTRLDKMLEANYGKDSKPKGDEYDAIAKPFMAANEAKLIDPLNVREVIDKLTAEIEAFKADVDLALTESNVRTEIEVPD